jgi:hypothetical protein
MLDLFVQSGAGAEAKALGMWTMVATAGTKPTG